ncbi:serine/threonine-protein kinase [Pseudomonas alliivorans]|uniref:Serine/threonine protein kinase n=1 Tax=Pseudomonas alliivorans TaxID=2810613 RepID=A0ABS4CDF8_9PSED|nr:serine/threonine-protein kinase [Pseudomonas alliivorans]MBP0948684.1 serine/threonine protein kinase [Pseudomonas alliivorans]MEE4329029.1 serine/threonine-protein kinase [Pseudomonas alliivorans]MEE4335021.1 serine/threonine-protein kinase [Pseudomonas alliivorans]MEE4370630.1 serine/threonine-protein kinase [Pseudomonas alliivorans]MEE4672051.1 serine/threonine-protein kinase [Pseudomonas alliivorans]
MTELIRPTDDLLVSEEQDNNLTYFAFAKSHKAEPALAPTKASIGEMPEVLAGRYRIERLLGAGGMGAVYRARDLLSEQFGEPDPYVALKILSEEFAESPDASALLYSEFALTRRLRHNNVLRLHTFEVDTDCQRAFITMELMRGLTLDKLLCERPLGLPWKELRDIALPLLDALAYAHARGVLHGDMKPSNVMLSEEGLRLFDFGLGQAEEGVMPGLPHLSRDRFNAWTPGYAAPELLEGQTLSASADVYGVACVIFELAGGKHPFRRLPSTQARDERLERELKAPGNLPKHCWPALRSALTFDARDRKITAKQLRDAFAVTSSRLQRLMPWCNG